MIPIDQILQQVNTYIHNAVGGNEIAAGMVIAWLMGSVTYLVRDIPSKIYAFLVKHLTTTMVINNSSELYYDLAKYLTSEGLIANSRSFIISNGRYDDGDPIKQLGYSTQLFWFRGRPVRISVTKSDSVNTLTPKESLEFTTIGRDHAFLESLAKEASSKNFTEDRLRYYSSGGEYCDFVTDQRKRSIDTVILKEEIRGKIKRRLDEFINKEQWYIENDIPYQLGIFLYGPSGTGKTTLLRAIASYLNRDIVFVTNLSGLTEQAQKQKNRLIVAEELDTFGIDSRDLDSTEDSKTASGNKKAEKEDDSIMGKIMEDLNKGQIGKVLTALDGVISNHGRIIVFTSNKNVEDFDPALMRPGRIDLALRIGHLDDETFPQIFKKFYPDHELSITQFKSGVSPAQFQERVLQGATATELEREYTLAVS